MTYQSYNPNQTPKRLTRSMTNKMIGGVCGGFADYFDMDATVIRVLAVILLLFGIFPMFLAYLAAWIIMPAEF
ncbi:PspC family transcriptional regulator [Corynebacterium hadale]|uniref:PspC family transcriptional regulator n=1 Tax=Corynebacterium hadale TaxID=2026255 RepID=A0AB36RLQ3_9CORY|nr:PspC domain-containing protein [Corynebacterium hadale]PAT08935.1 PspC family transcriptional regulator [Corynebacterium hadale]PAT11384.1 PspC family transcriptional regulator [Corynebacterium hadale]